jgi:cation diffusion facilitator CzcD-associated flavoprotein CzcO
MSTNCCIIGAGPSGITAAKNLLDAGMSITVYDQGSEVGGNWVYTEAEGHSSVFETTHIISSKSLSEYEDFPMPADYPDYPSHKHLATYFQAYAKQFNLYPHIQFNTKVLHCERMDDGRWKVEISSNDQQRTEIFDVLVVCNGHHWNPRMPSYPGQFNGRFMHSHGVKRFSDFTNERVLVIGGGNSACDVAVESSRVAASVDLSWRRGYWVAPKFIMGKPADVGCPAGSGSGYLPPACASATAETPCMGYQNRKDRSVSTTLPSTKTCSTRSVTAKSSPARI